MDSISDTDRLVTLFKRSVGYANMNTTYALNQEDVVSRPAIQSDRVFVDTVPTSAPTDLTTATPVVGGGTRQYSAAYPHIVKYTDIPLLSFGGNPQKTFYADVLTNALLPRVSEATPPTSAYDIIVSVVRGSGPDTISKANYILDRDAGKIMIFDNDVNNTTPPVLIPTITFWRYEGDTLADVGSGGVGPDIVAETLTLNTSSTTGTLTAIKTTNIPKVAYVAAGQVNENTFGIQYSYDGVSWYTATGGSFIAGAGRAVAYNGSRWVAVGEKSGPIALALYSDDGINWNTADFVSDVGKYDVAWANERWITVGAGLIQYSNDGITWYDSASSVYDWASNIGRKVIWDNTRWIAVGKSPSSILISTDNGLTWVNPYPSPTNFFNVGDVRSIAYNGIWYVAVGVGDSTTSIRYSKDYITWETDPASNGFTTSGNDVFWNGSVFVAVGEGGATIKYIQLNDPNQTPKIWSDATGGFDTIGRSIKWNAMANNGNGMWIAGGGSLTSIKYSTDVNGSTWMDASGSAAMVPLGVSASNTVELGRIGIGITTPSKPLDVCGDAKVRGSLYIGNNGIKSSGTLSEGTYTYPSTNDSLVIDSGAGTYNGSVGSILFKTNANNNPLARIAAVDTAAGGGAFKGDLVLQTGYNTYTLNRLRISNNGYDARGTDITLGSGTNLGTAIDTTTYGLERSRNTIQFSSYRDVTPNRIGAKIAGINKQTYTSTGSDTSLIQSTDLAFYTVPPNITTLDGTLERMRITDTGNVGIGTNAPESILDIYQALPYSNISTNTSPPLIAQINIDSGSQRLKIGSYYTGGEGASGVIQSTDVFSNADHGTGLLLNPIGGNVGIGKSNPGAKLDVAGDIRVGASTERNQIRFYGLDGDGTGGYGHTVIAEQLYGTIDQSELILFKGNDNGQDRVRVLASGGFRVDSGGSMIWTDNGSAAPTASYPNTLVVTGNGNIGINTADPQYKLDISGDIISSGSIRTNRLPGYYYPNNNTFVPPAYKLESRICLYDFTGNPQGLYYGNSSNPNNNPFVAVTSSVRFPPTYISLPSFSTVLATIDLSILGDIKNFEIEVTGSLGPYKDFNTDNRIYCTINSSFISYDTPTFFTLGYTAAGRNCIINAKSRFTIAADPVAGATKYRIIQKCSGILCRSDNGAAVGIDDYKTILLDDANAANNLSFTFFQLFDGTGDTAGSTNVNIRLTTSLL